MMLVPLLTALLCTCAHYASGLGMMGLGMPMLMGKGRMGHGLGHGDRSSEKPEKVLTCSNKELDQNSNPFFAIAVTVQQDSSSSSGWGMKGMNGMWGGMGGGSRGADLSAQIELLSFQGSGEGLIAFTSKAQPESLCVGDGVADFGNILQGGNDLDDYDNGRYGGFGHGMGMGYPDMMYGMGFGYGHGMGYLGLGDYTDFNSDDDGVIATLPFTVGTVSTLSVDGLPFDDLGELAGRGLVICTSVSTSSDGNYVCDKPYIACCKLRYDDRSVSVSTLLPGQVNPGI